MSAACDMKNHKNIGSNTLIDSCMPRKLSTSNNTTKPIWVASLKAWPLTGSRLKTASMPLAMEIAIVSI